jgi:precorrin-3B methylase
MPQTIRQYWGPLNGRVPLNYNWNIILHSSTVLVTASQYDPSNLKRFVGDATITVDNIEPHSPPWDPNNGVTFVVTVDWPSPLPVVTDITVMEQNLIEVDFYEPAQPPPPPLTTTMPNTVVSITNNANSAVNVTTSNFNTTNISVNSVPIAPTQTETLDEIIDQSILYFGAPSRDVKGRLVVVGCGIRAISDMTLDAESQIRAAQKVLYCVADPVTERRLHALNASAQSLYGLYGNEKPRIDTYREMLEAILSSVRAGLSVCVVYYSHPGVFAWSTHQAVRIARREGFRAEMHPGISADASLFADLGIDPSQPGCHSLEATDFLVHRRTPDVSAHVLLWQVECVGDFGFNFSGYKRHNFHLLIERLRTFYPGTHPVIIYEGAQLPQGRPKIVKSSLTSITKDDLTGISTLYLPPAATLQVDQEMCQRLGLSSKQQGATKNETPLTDFIASLADPATLERFRADPTATATAAGLSEDLVNLVVAGHPGTVRVRGIQELEHAGLAPVVSDKFALGSQSIKVDTSNSRTREAATQRSSASATATAPVQANARGTSSAK